MKPSSSSLRLLVFSLGFSAAAVPAFAQGALPASLPELPWQLTARPWTPLDTPRTDPLDKVEDIITALAPLQYWNQADPGDVQDGGDVQNGAIIDPFNLREHQYATPYFSFAVATAVAEGRAVSLLEAGARALDHSTADIAGLDGSAKANDNHGEFFGAPMMKALRLFKQLAPRYPAILTPARVARWDARLSTSRTAYMNNGVGQNWRTYGMKGEWMRVMDGLVPREAGTGSGGYQGVSYIEWYWNNEQRARYARDRDQFQLEPYFLMYHDDDTNSRQNFAYHGGATGNLLDLIRQGYDGPSRNDMLDTLSHAARSSLLTMSGNGDAPAAGRTGNHIWNDIVYGNTYDQMAELRWAAGDPRLAGQYRRAARLAFQSAWRFQQEQGWFSVTKSLLPPAHKNVYYGWSALTNYNGYTEIHSAEAFATRLSAIPEQPVPAEIGGFAFNLDHQFATAFANAGGMQVQLCTRGSGQGDLQSGVNSFTLGIVRFSRPDWESRLGPADGWTAANLSQAISFAPTFEENGVWKLVSELPDRYAGVFTPSFVHPLLVRGTLALAPKSGQSGPSFELRLTLTPDGVLVDTARTAGSAPFGTIWPLMEFDGKHLLDAHVGPAVATTAYPKSSHTRVVIEAESAALSGGAAVSSGLSAHSGAGHVALPSGSAAIEWSDVPGGDGGAASIGFRYVLPQSAAASRTVTLRVNGEARPITFVHTGDANSYGGGVLNFPLYWHQLHLPVTLRPGSTNTIRLENADGSGLVIDELRVFPADAALVEPDQQTFIALDTEATIDGTAAPRRSAYGDQRPLRVANAAGSAAVATFVYPRKAGDPAADAVRASFARDGADFSSVLGRVKGDTYVGRTSAGGVASGLDLDGDGADDVSFDRSCAFVLQLADGVVTAVEADRFVRFDHAGRRIALAPHSPVRLGASAGFWNHLAVPASGRRFESTVEFTPPAAPSGVMLAGFSGEGVATAGALALGLEFGGDGRVVPFSATPAAELTWIAGVPHRIRLLVDFPSRRYDLWVKPAGRSEHQLVAGAALPASVQSATDLDVFAWIGAPADAAGAATAHEFATPFAVKINFQAATSAGYPGYLPDTGAAFGDRGAGHRYGWIEGANTGLTRDRNSANSPDERHDTLNQMQYNHPPTETHTWEIAVPDGSYDVRLVCGDPDYTDSYYHVLAEGRTLVQGDAAGAGRRFFDQRARVTVADGRLTLTNGPGAYRNKICFIEIASTATEPYPFVTYKEWAAGRFVGGEAAPEAAPQADPDGNGVPNLLEYAVGAARPGASLALVGDAGDAWAEFSFPREAAALDASYSVWETQDLVNWDRLWDTREDADFSSPLIADAGDRVTLQVPLDPTRARQFFRLQVALP